MKKGIKSAGRVRIIAGNWRGRVLPVVAADGLRPTGDRMRETLFNWLGSAITDSYCLDACAGTGALGFEALSRGARHCTFVEPNAAAAKQLHESAALLGADVDIVRGKIEAKTEFPDKYDIVFFDPPFDADLWPSMIPRLRAETRPGGHLYVEAPTRYNLECSGLDLLRERVQGKTVARLYKRAI